MVVSTKSRLVANGEENSFAVVRIVFIALLLDILAFTIILPLFPRLLEYYHSVDRLNQWSLIHYAFEGIEKFKQLLSNQKASIHDKWDLVLLGGAIGSLFSFLQFIAAPFIGICSDRLGRRKTLLLTMLGNIVSTSIWMFAGHFEQFLLARIVGGLSEGNVQLSVAIISDVTSVEKRSRGLAMVGIAFAIAFTIGPATGAYFASKDLTVLLPFLSSLGLNAYSAPAFVALLLLLVETLFLYTFLPETSTPKFPETAKPKSQSQLGINEQQRLANLTILNYTHLVYLFVFSGMEFTLTFLTFDIFDFSNMQQGKLLGYIGILSSLLQGGYVRRLAHKVGEKRIVLQGIFMCSIGLGIIASMAYQKPSMTMLYAGATCLAFTSATVVNCLTSLASIQCDDEATTQKLAKGEALGYFRSLGQLGRSTGPIVACALYWLLGPAACYGIGSVCMLCLGMAAIKVLPSNKQHNE
ncbi:hypothetical protein BZG36_03865 [Bifiguratus adelaidae]|uniref:Major facilitator superfamily (MFS) profile domain-containing protein n=1 Tax=Bifiguratus adelaidae TaxID=1938954 RepID=A0A261XXQ6_9FUNG|nr:hypothetical protein BZG36_03865 [Bifiguratus adelaidae]